MLDTLDMQYPVTQEEGVNFIIDVDKDGNEISHTSNLHSALYTNIGWSPNPIVVHFEKAVLDKYYSKSNTYTVTDMFLSCHPDDGEMVWILPFDDDHNDRVCVLLSYLSLMLPYKELLHWREHNIPPEGGLSDTYCKRFAQGIPAESNQLEHLFRLRYFQLNQWCDVALGSQLLLPLVTDDTYRLRRMRIPSSENQGDFDDMAGDLVVVLIDSLNQECLRKLLPPAKQAELEEAEAKSITYLQAVLCHYNGENVENAKEHIKFLRKLQGLRSTGISHRKGKKYLKSFKCFELDQGLQKGFTRILRRATEVLECFLRIVPRGELSGKTEMPLLYDLREHLGALSQTLFPVEIETGSIYREEPHVPEVFSGRELVPGITEKQIWDLSHHLMTEVVPEYNVSPLEFRNHCERTIISNWNPDITVDLQVAITEIAKQYIKRSRSLIWHDIGIISLAEQIDRQSTAEALEKTTETLEETASRVTYSKKLVDCALEFVNHDAVADHSWYPQYVLHLFSYLLGYATYVYEYVLRVNGEDSIERIKDLVSLAKNTTDVIEKIASDDVRDHLQVVTTAVNALDQAVNHQ